MKTQFKIFNYYVNNTITSNDISLAVNKFCKENLINSKLDVKIAILFKIKTIDGCSRNISTLQVVNNLLFEDLKDVFITSWNNNLNIYQNRIIESIVFTYMFLEHDLPDKFCKLNYLTSIYNSKTSLPKYYENLPNNIKIETWGDEFIILNDFVYKINKDNGSSFHVIKLNNENFVKFSSISTSYYFQDIYNPNHGGNDTFMRIIGDIQLYYFNGKSYIINDPYALNFVNNINCMKNSFYTF